VNTVHISIRFFLTEKLNDHSLLVLHPAVKNLHVQRRSHFMDRRSLSARARIPSSGARKVHMIGCLEMHEALLGSRWRHPRPILMATPYFYRKMLHPRQSLKRGKTRLADPNGPHSNFCPVLQWSIGKTTAFESRNAPGDMDPARHYEMNRRGLGGEEQDNESQRRLNKRKCCLGWRGTTKLSQ
jgi:hypothetical protein